MRRGRQAVFLFGEGSPATPTVLGGKGAGLADMVRLGVPVPPGFTVTTAVARAFAQHKRLPRRLDWQMRRGMAALERQTGKRFGATNGDPLLVSVRSGAAVSMPGMMDTVLNLGLNPSVVGAMAEHGSSRFAWDCYRRFLSMFGGVVLDIERKRFDELFDASALDGLTEEATSFRLREACDFYRALIEEESGFPVPDDPWEQLLLAITAVFESWNSSRAVAYRDAEGIDHNLGTAVNIQTMVFGNRGRDSGTGVVFSRNASTGQPGLWGEFLPNAQGEDVVAGVRTPRPIAEMEAWNPTVHAELDRIVRELEDHHGDVVDVEFTVEQGCLHILQVRVAQRTPEAAATVAVHQVWAKQWTKETALARVTREQMQALESPGFEPEALQDAARERCLGRGLPASPGAVVGRVVCSSAEAVKAAEAGEQVVLVRPDTSPDDLLGMLAAVAIVTRTGGATCHAPVVARGQSKPAVVGCKDLDVSEGEIVSVDGRTGMIFRGEVKLASFITKKELNIFRRWARAAGVLAPLPRLSFEHLDQPVSANRLINDFYLADAMALASVSTGIQAQAEQLRNEIQTTTAELLAGYLAVAVAGELRHSSEATRRDNCPEACERLRTVYGVVVRGGDRIGAQTKTIKMLRGMSVEEQAEFFALATTVFERGSWSSSFGGKKWAAIAQAGHGFLTGKLAHSVFADHAFDLQHNNGSVFGKHPMIGACRSTVHVQLERKKHAIGVLELQRQLCTTGGFSPSVEECFKKGTELGIWEAEHTPAA